MVARLHVISGICPLPGDYMVGPANPPASLTTVLSSEGQPPPGGDRRHCPRPPLPHPTDGTRNAHRTGAHRWWLKGGNPEASPSSWATSYQGHGGRGRSQYGRDLTLRRQLVSLLAPPEHRLDALACATGAPPVQKRPNRPMRPSHAVEDAHCFTIGPTLGRSRGPLPTLRSRGTAHKTGPHSALHEQNRPR
jgi:hypothetical protein